MTTVRPDAARVGPVQPAAVRRKVEAWLAEADESAAIALKARPEWAGEPALIVGDATVRVVACPTPLAVRAALHDRVGEERLVLLTDLTDAELGDGLLAHVSRQTVRSVDPWDMVSQMFGGAALDPSLVRTGRWAADALATFAPAERWPAPAGTVLTRDHALRCLAGGLLGIDREQIDSAGLLQWSIDAPAVLRYMELPASTTDGLNGFLGEICGAAAVPILAAVRAGHGVDAMPLGLLAGVLWQGGPAGTEVAVARTRLEPWFGGARLTEAQATAFRDAAEAWVDRALDSGHRAEAQRILGRAEAIAADIDATTLLGASSVLPHGFVRRLRALAEAVRLAVPAGSQADAGRVARAQSALARVEEHRAADPARVDTARMAVRLLRWLSTVDSAAPDTLYEALHRQVREDGWVDRARLDIFAGDIDPTVAEAYQMLHRAVQSRRTRHDEQFARLLAAATAADAEPGALLLVEHVLERVVRPILNHGRRVLLLVLDGMSVAAATELAESVTSSAAWLELTPDGGPRTGVLAALPTVTEVSRCSLFSGRIAVGQQAEEVKAFVELFPGGVLLHKAALRSGAGAAVDHSVLAALEDQARPLVAAVVNTIDDALDRSDPGTVVWGTETIRAVRDLLAVTQDRVVVVVSDHGHVIDRGPEAVTRPAESSENRWRTAALPPSDGEVLASGRRVAKDGGSVVLPWREELRYGPRKAGYHGGASPAEAVIPLLVFSSGDEQAVPGWSGAPVASPEWWRESVPGQHVATHVPVTGGGKRSARPPRQDTTLFDLDEQPGSGLGAPASAADSGAAPPSRPGLVDALLASDVYAVRRGTRAPLPDERVAALLGVLLAEGGRSTLDNLAAHARVPAHRIGGIVTALRKLLQVEGYPVIDLDPDGRTVRLDAALLAEQFHLEAP